MMVDEIFEDVVKYWVFWGKMGGIIVSGGELLV